MSDLVRVAFLYLVSSPVLIGSFERMAFILQYAASAAPASWLDQRYVDHLQLTALHLLPGIVFFLIAPLQFSSTLRSRARRLHRALGRLFILTGVASGLAVLWMVLVFPAVGGLLTQVVTFVLVGAMLALLGFAWRSARMRAFARHRAAMMRAYAIGLSVSTARIFIELSAWGFGLGFVDTFVIASALGVALNIAVVEWVLAH
jgi:uncharacterized membrane protein